jgi:hypothetical protein
MTLDHEKERRLEGLDPNVAAQMKGAGRVIDRRFRHVAVKKPHPLLAIGGRIDGDTPPFGIHLNALRWLFRYSDRSRAKGFCRIAIFIHSSNQKRALCRA